MLSVSAHIKKDLFSQVLTKNHQKGITLLSGKYIGLTAIFVTLYRCLEGFHLRTYVPMHMNNYYKLNIHIKGDIYRIQFLTLKVRGK